MVFASTTFLQVIDEQPITVSTAVDEYYVGETVRWTVKTASQTGPVKLAVLTGGRVIAEHTGTLSNGVFAGPLKTAAFQPGVYTLRAITVGAGKPQQTQRQFIVAADPFQWQPEANIRHAKAEFNHGDTYDTKRVAATLPSTTTQGSPAVPQSRLRHRVN